MYPIRGHSEKEVLKALQKQMRLEKGQLAPIRVIRKIFKKNSYKVIYGNIWSLEDLGYLKYKGED